MKEFYVYQLRAENEVLPFYIGKGTRYRITQHLLPYSLKWNTLKNNKIKSLINKDIKVVATKLFTSSCEESCFEMEQFLINLYGRRDIGTGILTNHTDGGEGQSGRICSDEQRKANGLRKKGTKLSDEHKEKIKQSNLVRFSNPLNREKISKSMKGRKKKPMSEEQKEKIRQTNLIKMNTPEMKKRPPMSEEQKEKIRATNLLRMNEPEMKKKISIAMKKKNQDSQ
jgi:hypothetical protein